MYSQGPRLKNGVDLQLQSAFHDQNWPLVVQLADKRLKALKDQYYEVVKVCAESRLDDPAAKFAAQSALTQYANDDTVIKDADAIDLLEWATRDLNDEDDFPSTLGPLRVRAAKAAPKNKDNATRCLESCLLHWDLVSAQQIAALLDRSFPQERSFLFWNIVVTHLLSISPQCPSEKKKLYGMLAFRQIERAAQATEQAENEESLPARSIQTEEEILLLYDVFEKHGTPEDYQKLLSNPVFAPSVQFTKGRKEPFVRVTKKLQTEQSWESLFNLCRACLSTTDDKGQATMLASDWTVWRKFIDAASHLNDTNPEVHKTVQDLLLQVVKSENSKPIYRRNVMLARISAAFTLLPSDEPDIKDGKPASFRMRELIQYIDDQAHNPACFDDVKSFVESLDSDGIQHLAHEHYTAKASVDDVASMRKQLFALKLQYFETTCPQVYNELQYSARLENLQRVVAAGIDMYKSFGDGGSSTPPAATEVQSEVAMLFAACLVDLATLQSSPTSLPSPQSTKYLVQALLLLDQQLVKCPKHSQITLLLVQLHLLLGSGQEAREMWETLAVKNTIMDSLAPIFYDRLSTVAPGLMSPDDSAGWQLMQSIKTHYQTSLKMRMPRRLIDAFEAGSYSAVLDIPRYIENLRASGTRAMSLVESARSERLLQDPETDLRSDPRFTEVDDDVNLNEAVDYGSFPSWSSTSSLPICKRLRIGPTPTNRRLHMSLLSESFHEILSYKPPSFYKVQIASLAADQTYVLETIAQLGNSFAKFLPGPQTELTASEHQYFHVLGLLCTLVPACASRANGLVDVLEQITGAVTAAMESQRDAIAALAADAEVTSSLSLLRSLHKLTMLRETATAVQQACQWIFKFNDREKERDRSGQSNIPKDTIAQLKNLDAAAAAILKGRREWITRMKQDVASGGIIERDVKKLVFGDELGKTLRSIVTDDTVFRLVGSWRKNITAWHKIE